MTPISEAPGRSRRERSYTRNYNWYSPGGFEGYFEEMGAFLESLPPGPPDMEEVGRKASELSEVYDQTIVDSN